MILIVLAALCVLSVPLTGGRLGRLADLRLRWLWLAPLALGTQVLIVTIAPGGDATLHAGVHIGTYAVIGVFLWANRAVAGARIIALGALANSLEIVINGGVMPASLAAILPEQHPVAEELAESLSDRELGAGALGGRAQQQADRRHLILYQG